MKKIDEDIQAEWERFLDPKELRSNLILASLYIAAFEVLKNSIIEQIRDFYITGFDVKGLIISPEYKKKVLSKDRSLTYASLDWLKEHNVIDGEDIENFNKVKKCRNLLAHEITKCLKKGLPADIADNFTSMVTLLDKIEKWWIINVEIPTDPNLMDHANEIDTEGIIPGPILGLKLMIDVALGSDEIENFYIDRFKKTRKTNDTQST
jgi:hypothetical protein